MLLFVWLCGFFHVSRRTRGNREAELHAHPWNYMTVEFHMESHDHGIPRPWNYMPMELQTRGITYLQELHAHGTNSKRPRGIIVGSATKQCHVIQKQTPSTCLKKKSKRCVSWSSATHLPATSAGEDPAHKSQQKDARQQPQCRRRIRLGVRCGSCHSPRSFGGILPPSRQIGLPPCLGRSVGRISRSYDLRVVRGNFQQVSIELFGCRPFREGCLLIRDAVFLRGCGSNVGKYKS